MTEYIIQSQTECEQYVAWIARFLEQNGSGPTIRETAEAWGISRTWVQKYFAELEDRGYIERPKDGFGKAISRRIKIIKEVDAIPYGVKDDEENCSD